LPLSVERSVANESIGTVVTGRVVSTPAVVRCNAREAAGAVGARPVRSEKSSVGGSDRVNSEKEGLIHRATGREHFSSQHACAI